MTQQDALLSALLKSEQRRPVDVNLGQVPITPTIGRMGNYTVVTRETPKDNPALELSRALSQLPQLLGQAKNISVASGLKQAEEMDLEEIEKRYANGDTEAEGFMTWLGGNKAFHEATYQRLFDANIKPRLQKVSSEIDGMTNGELLQFDSDEAIKEYAQGRLVGSLDPGVMETIEGNSWLEIRHNKAMEAIIPGYVQKASASIDARKRDFQEKEALAAVETNFFAHADFDIALPGFDIPDSAIDQMDSALAASQSAQYIDPNKLWKDNLQASIDFAVENGFGGRLDKFQIEAKLIPALTAKYRMLIEDDKFSEADLFLELMESGSLNINGRPLNKSSAGMRLIQNAEALLENALEAGEDKIDTEKMDSHQSDLLSMIAAEKVKPGYDPDTFAGSLQEMEDEVLNDPTKKWNDKEKIQLSNIYARARDGLYGRGEIHAETSDEKREELGEEITKKFNLSAREQSDMTTNLDIIKSATIDTGATLSDYKNYITKEVNDGVNPVYEEFRDPILKILTANALQQAVKETVGSVVDLPENELFLGTYKTDEEQKNQSLFRNGLQTTLQERYKRNVGLYVKDYIDRIKSQNPPLSDEEAQKREMESVDEEISKRHYKRGLSGGEALINANGEITSKIRPTLGSYTPYAGPGSSGEVVTFYPLDTANETIKNKYGLKILKENPILKRLELMAGLEKEASNPARLKAVGKTLDKIYGTDVYDDELKRELELVRYSGISFGALLDGGRADGNYTTKTGMFGPLAPKADQRQVPWTIDYNKFKNFSTAAATKERIFNLGAITRYKQQGKDDDFRRIHSALLKNSGISLEAFIQNQVKLAESVYGNLEE